MPYPLLHQQIEKITPLTDEEFDYIAGHFTLKKLRKHQFLVQEGDAVHNDYFVLRGCLKAYHTDAEGKDRILAICCRRLVCHRLSGLFFANASHFVH